MSNHATALDRELSVAFGGQPRAFGAAEPKDFSANAAGASSVGTFIMTVVNYVASIGKQFIDTPEERKALHDAVLVEFDTYVAPSLGPLTRMAVRMSLDAFVTNALETFGK